MTERQTQPIYQLVDHEMFKKRGYLSVQLFKKEKHTSNDWKCPLMNKEFVFSKAMNIIQTRVQMRNLNFFLRKNYIIHLFLCDSGLSHYLISYIRRKLMRKKRNIPQRINVSCRLESCRVLLFLTN